MCGDTSSWRGHGVVVIGQAASRAYSANHATCLSANAKNAARRRRTSRVNARALRQFCVHSVIMRDDGPSSRSAAPGALCHREGAVWRRAGHEERYLVLDRSIGVALRSPVGTSGISCIFNGHVSLASARSRAQQFARTMACADSTFAQLPPHRTPQRSSEPPLR